MNFSEVNQKVILQVNLQNIVLSWEFRLPSVSLNFFSFSSQVYAIFMCNM